jgi:hypothetical protein
VRKEIGASLAHLSGDDIGVTNILRGSAQLEGNESVDWRKVSVEHIAFDPEELKQNLIPVLRGEAATMFENGRECSERFVRETRENLSRVLPFTNGEVQFLEALLERAEIQPEHLTDDAAMIAKIKDLPMLHWKALNVKRFKGL